jgi:phosphotriesterase-related protein
MTRVNTVLGPIAVEQLGFTSIHEHIGYGMPGSELDTRWWKTPEQRYEETIPKLRKFAEYGGQTFVDATGICNGRDIDYYQSISEKTGVNIIAATGFVGGDTALKHFAEASVEYLADQFIHELTVGISRTGGKAGIIKVGVSRGFKMTALDLRIYRAAARASLATGAPIITHLAVDAQSAIDVFDEEGLPLTRVLFGHADDGVSQGKVDEEGIVGAGGRIGFDTFGYDLELPDRFQHLMRYLRSGQVDKVLVAADANCSPLGWPGVKGHTINYLFEQLIPDLKTDGVSDAVIDQLFVGNVADFFSTTTPLEGE